MIFFDTETTGLNIIKDRPFIITYKIPEKFTNTKLVHTNNKEEMFTFTKHLEEEQVLIGFNITYDIHMLINIGFDPKFFQDKTIYEIKLMVRLGTTYDEQIRCKNFSLKYLAKHFCNANISEKEQLDIELSTLNRLHKQKFMQEFYDIDKTVANDIYSNWYRCFNKYPQYVERRKSFFLNNPKPTYKDISNVEAYAIGDVDISEILFNEFWERLTIMHNLDIFKNACKALYPLILMERKGLVIDTKKLYEDKIILENYFNSVKIIDPRNGNEVSIGQHKVLKDIYSYEVNRELSNSDKNTRNSILNISPTAKLVNDLSEVNKYITTYVARLYRDMVYDKGEYKLFSQYDIAGTITGRLSSNLQQFPKEPLVVNGHTISIRNWFKVPYQDAYMFYFDYSQLELRLQCEWTGIINNGVPDTNLARAFKPFKCIEKDGKYYLEEDPTVEWKPTDLHALTALHAFPITKDDPNFSHYRSLGKRTNFACNYGASAPKLSESLDVDMQTAENLIKGYYKTFPIVIKFVELLKKGAMLGKKFRNLFGRYYYTNSPHHLRNWLVQGSGADLLLLKLVELERYIRNKPHWNLMITVHDEIGLTCKRININTLKKEVKEIKDLLGHKLTYIDIISDVEVTKTYWGEKEEYDI